MSTNFLKFSDLCMFWYFWDFFYINKLTDSILDLLNLTPSQFIWATCFLPFY